MSSVFLCLLHLCHSPNVNFLCLAEEIGEDDATSANVDAAVEDIRRFKAIDAIRNAAADTVIVSLTGKELLILVLVLANVFTLTILVCRCAKCCSGNEVKYAGVGVLSEGTEDEMSQMDDEMDQMIQ